MGNFKFLKTSIDGVIIVEPTVYGDSRGFFMETYQKEEFAAGGIDVEFVQDNHSMSSKGVLRGLHFQKKYSQSKLVRCIKGEVFDVAVDLRDLLIFNPLVLLITGLRDSRSSTKGLSS